MSNYTPLVNYAAKDALTTGNPSKKILGTEISAELSAISTAISTKEDSANKNLASGYLGLDANSQASAAGYIVTGSTIPANGIYLPSANSLGFATNSTKRGQWNSTGGLTIDQPTSGTSLTVNRSSDGTFESQALTTGNLTQINTTVADATGVTMNVTGTVARSLKFSIFGTTAVDISSTRNVTINAPSSGTSLSVSSVAGGIPIQWNDGTLTGGISLSSSQVQFGSTSNHAASFYTNNLTRMSIAAAGNVTINAPDSGVALDVAGNGVNTQISFGAAGAYSAGAFNKGALHYNTSGGVLTLAARSNAGNTSINFNVSNGGTDRTPLSISNVGAVTVATPASGTALTVAGGGLAVAAGGLTVTAGGLTVTAGGLTVSAGGANITGTVTGTTFSGSGASLTNLDATQLTGTVNTARVSGSYTGITAVGNATVNDSGGSPFDIGFRDVPQVASTSITLDLTHRGKSIYANTTTSTVAIPANGTVAFPIGTTIVLVNDGSGSMTVSITTDTLAWLQGGAESTGTRTVATKSVVTLYKATATRWIISGSGIS